MLTRAYRTVKVELIVAPVPTTLLVCPSWVIGPSGFLRNNCKPLPSVLYDPGAPIETNGAPSKAVRPFPETSEGGKVEVNGWQPSLACHRWEPWNPVSKELSIAAACALPSIERKKGKEKNASIFAMIVRKTDSNERLVPSHYKSANAKPAWPD